MALLCFLLDLRTLSTPLLKDLKQCLLQLANLYAISSRRSEIGSAALQDRIGLCYVHRNRASSSDELKIAYCPRENFNLRDFHHAVNNLPIDCFLPESTELRVAGTGDPGNKLDLDVTLSRLLTKEALYSWGSKDILRKLILISSCLLQNIDALRKTLTDAAEECVSVEFVLLEPEASQVEDMSEYVKEFTNNISDLENCLLRRYFPVDTWVLRALVRRWLQELKDDGEESWQAVFLFKNSLVDSKNQIFCNLFSSTNQIIDGFSHCQACRCHGFPLGGAVSNKMMMLSCPVTYHELGAHDLVENVVKVGEQTLLFLPSFKSCPKLQRISAPISFNVMERTNLASLSEGVIIGASYIVSPLACDEMEAISDECDKPELNVQLFHALCRALYSLDQGLVCSSYCNLETMAEATFQCFYILQPSDKGPMLLRLQRLVGSEEILPTPDSIGSIDSSVPKEIENSIQASLSKIELKDYNPLLHERGFHPKLNWLVKESLHFGSIPTKRTEKSPKSSSPRSQSSKTLTRTPRSEIAIQERTQPNQTSEDEDAANIAEEWEQLIVHKISESFSPTCISNPRLDNSVLPLDNKQVDEKTSRILERLEAPRQQKKTKGSSPVVVSNAWRDACGPMKKPLVPFGSNHVVDQGVSLSQPMKPNFQRMKRKLSLSFPAVKGCSGKNSSL
ncbi:uncharacterized protein LOC143860655 isoform X2 [Tasmannia lanceolata]|uniref:uncharacterized protein LOC143860655 isoform X2 n=1 Tax=Tasmannia lanceolata TaxID=3420 RepID=UPI0040634145